MSGEVEDAFCRPVTWTVSVWFELARPVAVKTGAWICSVGEKVSTLAARFPSRNTLAIPVCGPFAPIQVIPVPVNVKLAWAPAVEESAAIPALHALLVSPCDQPTVL